MKIVAKFVQISYNIFDIRDLINWENIQMDEFIKFRENVDASKKYKEE